ncbi:MAG: hypothetical protein LBD51_06900, partial [Bifidobacteriaceae bacterium]|nr:hypothetical protein [Bifidobacteriaceae bacterium]
MKFCGACFFGRQRATRREWRPWGRLSRGALRPDRPDGVAPAARTSDHSQARGDDGPESDLDVLVDAAEGTGVLSIIALQHDLEDLLGVSVDVAP